MMFYDTTILKIYIFYGFVTRKMCMSYNVVTLAIYATCNIIGNINLYLPS